jgi:adenylate kinase family enzyme
MQRVAIIGSGGSGKSTLAVQLGRALNLPVHHLDRLYWKPGWKATPNDEWQALVRRLCEESAWIMDGNFGGTIDLRLSACDAVIFLDLPTRVCLWGAIRRLITYHGRSRPDMTEGCHEKLDLDYFWWILTYRIRRRPKIMRKLHSLGREKRVLILGTRKATGNFLSGVLATESLPT